MEDKGFKIYTIDTQAFSDEEYFRKCYASLSVRRRGKADQYRNPEDRKRSVAAGVLLDRGLREYGLCEAGVRIGQGENGKPYFMDYPDIHYNLSHSGSMALAVFAGGDVCGLCKGTGRMGTAVCVSRRLCQIPVFPKRKHVAGNRPV